MKIHTTALSYAILVSVWLTVLLTIASEISAPLKSGLVILTGHHWTSKGVVLVLAFFLTYFLLRKKEDASDIARSVRLIIASVVIGGLMIFGFFLYDFIGA